MHIAICGEVIFLLVSYSTELSKFTFSAYANYKYRQTERETERQRDRQAFTSMVSRTPVLRLGSHDNKLN